MQPSLMPACFASASAASSAAKLKTPGEVSILLQYVPLTSQMRHLPYGAATASDEVPKCIPKNDSGICPRTTEATAEPVTAPEAALSAVLPMPTPVATP